ncbi:hypothetical protein PYCC9005_001723 [Savitreella phatthalungensis]
MLCLLFTALLSSFHLPCSLAGGLNGPDAIKPSAADDPFANVSDVESLERRQAACPSYQIFTARGTGEAQVPSSIAGSGAFSSAVLRASPGGQNEGIVYSASASFLTSVAEGVAAFNRQLSAFTARCPSTPIVLFGYSQGAWVIQRALGSTSSNANIVAVVFWGNPAHQAGQSQNQCGGTGFGTVSAPLPARYVPITYDCW